MSIERIFSADTKNLNRKVAGSNLGAGNDFLQWKLCLKFTLIFIFCFQDIKIESYRQSNVSVILERPYQAFSISGFRSLSGPRIRCGISCVDRTTRSRLELTFETVILTAEPTEISETKNQSKACFNIFVFTQAFDQTFN